MRMKADINKVICPDFDRKVFNVCRNDNGEVSLGDPSMKPLLLHIQDLSCLILVLL